MPVTVAIIIALITISNSWHVLTGMIQNPPEHLFTGIAHYFADYFLYVSAIAQAQNSPSLFVEHLFTNEPLIPTWIYWFNALLGKIPISPFLSYNISLILLVAGLLLLLWHITKRSLSDSTTMYVTFIIAVTASNFFDFTTFFRFGTFKLLGDFWFSPTPALNRLGGVPHQVLQTILSLLVILLYTKLSESSKKNPSQYVLLGVVSFLAATANPIQMLLVALSILAIFMWKNYKQIPKSADIIVASIALLPALLGAMVTNFEFSHQPILTAAKTWENNQQFSLSIFQFIWALGPIGFFIPFGIFAFIKKHTHLYASLVVYTLLSLIFFFSPLPTYLGTSAVRWLSPASYIGLALLAGSGYMWCIAIIGKKLKHPQLTIGVALSLYLLLTIPSILTQIQTRTTPLTTDAKLISLNHIPFDVVDGLIHIQNAREEGVVLTDPTLFYDVVIPVMTGKKSFTGHPIHTLYPETKKALRQEIFSGTMNDQVAEVFMKNHAITYIISSPRHSRIFNGYPFLTVLFSNTSVVIYQRTP